MIAEQVPESDGVICMGDIPLDELLVALAGTNHWQHGSQLIKLVVS